MAYALRVRFSPSALFLLILAVSVGLPLRAGFLAEFRDTEPLANLKFAGTGCCLEDFFVMIGQKK